MSDRTLAPLALTSIKNKIKLFLHKKIEIIIIKGYNI